MSGLGGSDMGGSVTIIFYRMGKFWKEPVLNVVAGIMQGSIFQGFSWITHVEVAIGAS